MTMFALFLVIICSEGKAQAVDSYAMAIDSAVESLESQEQRSSLRSLLETSTSFWIAKPSYAEVRSRISDLGIVQRQLRLEIGNVNSEIYRVIWVAETTREEIIAYSNVFSAGKLERRVVQRAAWEGLISMWQAERMKLKRCQSDMRVDDGSSYFARLTIAGSTEEFAFYGYVPSPVYPEDSGLIEATAPCGKLVSAVYALVRKGA